MSARGWVMLIPILLMNSACSSADIAKHETPMTVGSSAVITWGEIAPDIGRFLLIRRGQALCAIKFTGAWRGNDATMPTLFNDGAESFRAEYDWYYTPNYKEQWGTPALRSGHSEVQSRAIKGLLKFSFNTANGNIECGSIKLHWNPATVVAFFTIAKQGDNGYEMALTKWRSVVEIKPDAPYLKWYRYDKSRPDQVIKTDDLL